MKLLPHQTKFIDTALSPTSRQLLLLRADVGSGKTTALAGLVERFSRESPAARSLVLVSGGLGSQWKNLLSDAGVTAMLVDRYRFRELLEVPAGDAVWPGGVAVVMRLTLAMEPDVRLSLISTRWDLVIVEDSARLTSDRVSLLRNLCVGATRVVLALNAETPAPEMGREGDVTEVNWRSDSLTGIDGTPLVMSPRPSWRDVPFTLTQAEEDLSEIVESLCLVLEASAANGQGTANAVREALASSPAAVEMVLLPFSSPPERAEETRIHLQDGGYLTEAGTVKVEPIAAAEARAIAQRAIGELEAFENDSKLSAFTALLGDLSRTEGSSSRVCVLTNFQSTLWYLTADMLGRGVKATQIRSGITRSDREESLNNFASNGEVLIITVGAVAEGFPLPSVTDLVLYDLPPDKAALQRILNSFEPFRSRHQLTIHVLAPTNDREHSGRVSALRATTAADR